MKYTSVFGLLLLSLPCVVHLAAMEDDSDILTSSESSDESIEKSMALLIMDGKLDEFKTYNLATLSYNVIEELVDVTDAKQTALIQAKKLGFNGKTWNTFKETIAELEKTAEERTLQQEKQNGKSFFGQVYYAKQYLDEQLTRVKEEQTSFEEDKALSVIERLMPFNSRQYRALKKIVEQAEEYAEKQSFYYLEHTKIQPSYGLNDGFSLGGALDSIYVMKGKLYIKQEQAKIEEMKRMLVKEYKAFTKTWLKDGRGMIYGYTVEKNTLKKETQNKKLWE